MRFEVWIWNWDRSFANVFFQTTENHLHRIKVTTETLAEFKKCFIQMTISKGQCEQM